MLSCERNIKKVCALTMRMAPFTKDQATTSKKWIWFDYDNYNVLWQTVTRNQILKFVTAKYINEELSELDHLFKDDDEGIYIYNHEFLSPSMNTIIYETVDIMKRVIYTLLQQPEFAQFKKMYELKQLL